MKKFDCCRASLSNNLIDILSIEMPIAGQFIESRDIGTDNSFPLTLSFCPDSSLLQIREVLDKENTFRKYLYKTGAIKTLTNHFEKLSSKFKASNNILELGCNDFSFLKYFDGGLNILGVDPSDVSAKAYLENNFSTISLLNDFFSSELADEIIKKNGLFDLIFSFNNFAHITDIRSYVKGISKCLKDNGSFLVEVHYLDSIINNLQFPFIYHEHQYYYSAISMQKLLSQFDMSIYDYELIDIHGGSIRFYIQKGTLLNEKAKELLEREKKMLFDDVSLFKDFSKKIKEMKHQTIKILQNYKKQNKIICAYGASGQANSLFAFYGIDSSLIDFIIDDSPLKIGKFLPNTHIPIVSRENIDRADVVFVTAYTFFEEIRAKNNTNKIWIKPLPKIEAL